MRIVIGFDSQWSRCVYQSLILKKYGNKRHNNYVLQKAEKNGTFFQLQNVKKN